MRTILIATSNPGKLRDFAAAAAEFNVQVEPVPGFDVLPPAREDAPTFEANACKKAEQYSGYAKDEYVLADDSGLVVDFLGGAPGVHSARFAALPPQGGASDTPAAEAEVANASDESNNARLLRKLEGATQEQRGARFVCSIAVARKGRLQACFHGEVRGTILKQPQGHNGFGYDPLFYYAPLQKTFAELSAEEKGQVSHRGQALRKFLAWFSSLPEEEMVIHHIKT